MGVASPLRDNGPPAPAGDDAPGRGYVAATVGGGGRVVGKHRDKCGDVAAARGDEESFDDAPPVRGIGAEPGRRLADALSCPAVQLAGVGFRGLQDLCDVAVAVGERFAQHERGAFIGAQPLQYGEQRDRHRVALFDGFQRAECAVAGGHRFGQPRAGVALAPAAGGRQWLRHRLVTTLASQAGSDLMAVRSTVCSRR